MSTKAEQELNLVKLNVPENVQLSLDGSKVTVKGKLGTLMMDFSKAKVQFSLEENVLTIISPRKGRQGRSILGTIRKKILNMIRGVNEKYVVRMRIVHSHFPITVRRTGDLLRIENFIGEKSPRLVEIPPGVEIQVKGPELLISGIDKDSVTQLAGSIESVTKIRGKDQRVYLDGIYVVEKYYERKTGGE